MAAGQTLSVGGSDYSFGSTEVWSYILGQSDGHSVTLNTLGSTLTVTALDALYGDASAGEDLVTLGGTGGNTLSVKYIESLIGRHGRRDVGRHRRHDPHGRGDRGRARQRRLRRRLFPAGKPDIHGL
jgi:hypothetical protein